VNPSIHATAFYNEIEPYLCAWLNNQIAAGLIPPGRIDGRDIRDLDADDLEDAKQVHLFAGVGGWAYAARLAGWPDDLELWSASCPCQPFSVAGKRAGTDDPRHLWPDVFRLVRARRPAVLVGEQVAAAVGQHWLDRVFSDLESLGYACRAIVVPACAVNAPHRRDRLWFVAHTDDARLQGFAGDVAGAEARWRIADGSVAPTGVRDDARAVADADESGAAEEGLQRGGKFGGAGGDPSDRVGTGRGLWEDSEWIVGYDGKLRRVPRSGIRLLAHGIPARIPRLRAAGNAIVPQLAAEVLRALREG
jgi:DNA (cytosine-5)-methyltransferase 1